MSMRKNIVAIAAAIAVAGCASAPTANSAELRLWKTVRLPAASAGAFATCLQNGFNNAHSVTHTAVRQVRGDGVTRVETWGASQGLQASALVSTSVRCSWGASTGSHPERAGRPRSASFRRFEFAEGLRGRIVG